MGMKNEDERWNTTNNDKEMRDGIIIMIWDVHPTSLTPLP
jgi:hypothetical protein